LKALARALLWPFAFLMKSCMVLRKVDEYMRFLIKYLAFLAGVLTAPVGAQEISPEQLIGKAPYESPSCNSNDHHELDFMLGEWDLKVMVDGRWTPGGYAKHTAALGGCVHMAIMSFENWGEFYKSLSGRTGYAGIALNSYDRKNRTWRQVWHDDMGTVIGNFRGRKYQDGVRFVGKSPTENGAELQRFSYKTIADHIREFTVEMSTGGGTQWTEIAKVQMIKRR